MINIKPEILQALQANATLLSLLGGNHIYQLVEPNADEFPRITFFEVTNTDEDYADDTAISSDILIQIDIWNKSSTSAIAIEVDKTMKTLSFQRTYAVDLYESDTQIFHKAMRYLTTREAF